MNKMTLLVLAITAAGFCNWDARARAANPADDDAAQSAYNSGWSTGSNGGYGFEPWIITATGAGGAQIQTSTWNGKPIAPPFPEGGDIDTGTNRSWSAFAVGGDSVHAVRPFTGGPLLPGQSVRFSLDIGPNVGQKTGIALRNASGEARFDFWLRGFSGREDAYAFTDGDASYDSHLVNSLQGLDVMFMLKDENHYQLGLAYHNSLLPAIIMYNGTLASGTGGIDRLDFYYESVQPAILGVNTSSFANSIRVVPEPTSPLILVTAISASLARRRPRPA